MKTVPDGEESNNFQKVVKADSSTILPRIRIDEVAVRKLSSMNNEPPKAIRGGDALGGRNVFQLSEKN